MTWAHNDRTIPVLCAVITHCRILTTGTIPLFLQDAKNERRKCSRRAESNMTQVSLTSVCLPGNVPVVSPWVGWHARRLWFRPVSRLRNIVVIYWSYEFFILNRRKYSSGIIRWVMISDSHYNLSRMLNNIIYMSMFQGRNDDAILAMYFSLLKRLFPISRAIRGRSFFFNMSFRTQFEGKSDALNRRIHDLLGSVTSLHGMPIRTYAD